MIKVRQWTGSVASFLQWSFASMFDEAEIKPEDSIEISITDGSILMKRARTKPESAKAILDIFYDGNHLPSYTFSTTPDGKYRLCAVTGTGIGVGMAEITDTCDSHSYFFQAISWYEAMQDYCRKCGERIPALDLLKDDFEFLKS